MHHRLLVFHAATMAIAITLASCGPVTPSLGSASTPDAIARGKTNSGILFKIVRSREKVVHDFASTNSNDGSEPWGDLVEVSGHLYGTTVRGGTVGDGTVFVQKP